MRVRRPEVNGVGRYGVGPRSLRAISFEDQPDRVGTSIFGWTRPFPAPLETAKQLFENVLVDGHESQEAHDRAHGLRRSCRRVSLSHALLTTS